MFLKHISKTGEQKNLTQVLTFIQSYIHERHHFSKLMALVVIIARNKQNKQQAEEEIHRRTTAKASMVLKE